jgi:hypothetical protein
MVPALSADEEREGECVCLECEELAEGGDRQPIWGIGAVIEA